MIIDYDSVINKLAADLDNRVTRNELIASNIANLDTPNYKSKDVKFHRILAETMDGIELKRTSPKHMGGSGDAVRHNEIIDNPQSGRADGNNVDIDDEMLKLSENNIQYNVSVQLMSKRLKHIQEAIAVK